MKKIMFMLLLCTLGATAQVKIGDNPTSIGASSILELQSLNKALVITRVANTAAIATPVNGMIVYDMSSNCVKTYENNAWGGCTRSGDLNSSNAVIANCDAGGFSGTFTSGTALSGAAYTVTITNNTFTTATINFSAADLVLSGVSGLTVGTPTGLPALSSGSITLASEQSVTITYPISGTPSTSGTLTGTWKKQSLTCTKTKTVTGLLDLVATNCSNTLIEGNYLANVNLSVDNKFRIVITNNSGAATQSLPVPQSSDLVLSGITGVTVGMASPSSTGPLANGASRQFTYNLQGRPASTGTLNVSWTYGTLNCNVSKEVNVLSSAVSQDYCTNSTFNGSYISGMAFTSANTFVVSMVNNSGSTISLPAPATSNLALSGIAGVTVSSVTANSSAVFANGSTRTYTYTLSGTPTGTGTLSAVWTYLDLTCTKTVNIPVPVPVAVLNGPNGTTLTFMSHNLGVPYTQDPHALVKAIHGNYYQWGRLNKVADADTGSGAISGWNTTSAADGAWAATKTAADPCPAGYRVPTNAEWSAAMSNGNQISRAGTFNDNPTNYGAALVITGNVGKITLPIAGSREYSAGSLGSRGFMGYYWSSTYGSGVSDFLAISNTNLHMDSEIRTEAYSVRCIKQ